MEYDCSRFEIRIAGPGDTFDLGNDHGEKLMVRRGQHQSGNATILLGRTSPNRARFSELFRYQERSSERWGRNIIEICDREHGNVVLTCREVAFRQVPSGEQIEFNVGKIETP